MGLKQQPKCKDKTCQFCTETDKGRPCVRALNETLRETGGKIDYGKTDEEYFEDIFQGGVNNE